jgi:iron complex transport system ATP-binding protein
VTGDDGERLEVISIRGVSVVRSGSRLLDGVDWEVRTGERWVLLGPNGSGKTTLVSVAATYLWPSLGTVSVLGRAVGSVDVRELRRQIGIVSASLEVRIPPQLSAMEIVVAGATGATAPWWDRPTAQTRELAVERLKLVGCAELRDRRFELLSSGERQRVQIARALMLDPRLLLLDEPAAGLDLGAREQLAVLLARLNADPKLEATVVVTHHVEEIAPGTTHAIVLRSGHVLAAGPVAETVTGPVLTAAFGLPLRVERLGGRFVAQAVSD